MKSDARRQVRIHPHEQLCSASAASCAYARKQLVLLLPNGNTARYMLLVGRCAYTHTNSLALSVASCVHTQGQPVLLLLNDDEPWYARPSAAYDGTG